VRAASLEQPLIVIVGAGGVGKTTIAAALGIESARAGAGTLVTTFDPSLRLKDALGVTEAAREHEVRVPLDARGTLDVSLLDARATFDRLVRRHAPDPAAAQRIFDNPLYQHLAGHLAGILEYMAVERLFEIAAEGRYQRVVLDTPPTRQALDFLEAPERIVAFLDSGAINIALRPWFAGRRLRVPLIHRRVARLLDRIVGLELLREMADFFQAFAPLYAGFRDRARQVQELLRNNRTLFVLVTGPGEERIPDTLFFARRLREAGHHLGPIVVNQVHPELEEDTPGLSARGRLGEGMRLLAWMGDRDARGLTALRALLTDGTPLVALPLFPMPPTGLDDLSARGRRLLDALAAARTMPRRGRRG